MGIGIPYLFPMWWGKLANFTHPLSFGFCTGVSESIILLFHVLHIDRHVYNGDTKTDFLLQNKLRLDFHNGDISIYQPS